MNTPSLESPRFSLRDCAFSEVDMALKDVGHVVIDDAFNPKFLTALLRLSVEHFRNADSNYMGNFDKHPPGVIDTYLGGCTSIEEVSDGLATLGDVLPGWSRAATPPSFWVSALQSLVRAPRKAEFAMDDVFFMELERAGLTALFRYLFDGTFVAARSERVIRRVDPAFPLRFAGLHCDGQLNPCSTRGFRSKRELTSWVPLQSCIDDDIARLLVLHRGETYIDAFSENDYMQASSTPFLPIQLRPVQIRNEDGYRDVIPKIDDMYQRLFSTKRCYAPKIDLGGFVLFDQNIWHGSYYSTQMKRARFSLDFRAVSEYAVTKENKKFSGLIYGVRPCPT